ncbi:tetratricopeptide repeat protein [Streptomyces sp. NPDC101227]|uniref:tetratricopeptide repeat protein n=1 Tax=Streptomyces sp. NPDC101227 TaxID=3366136 RepID=UPI003826379D
MNFVNREDEQTRAFAAVEEWNGRSRPLCLALSGPGGSGKTELAFRIARALRDRCPDGVLYVDLDDFRRDGAVEAADALGQMLGSLGIGPEMLGHTFKARCRQYWTQTDGKRLIVIIDNARYGAEVVPLLPASGAGVAIIASHGPLYDIEDGATVDLELPPLDEADSAELLRLIVRDPRLTDEPEAARGLVHLCSGLPAALHVAARWIRKHRRRPLSRLLAELTRELNEKGVPVVEQVWDAAYRSLGDRAALLYRLLAEHPGPSFTPESAAAILGLGRDAADEALEELETAGLLDTRDVLGTEDGRMRLPELLRAHARRRGLQDGDETGLADARRRIVLWFLRQAQRADALAAGPRLVLADAVPPVPGAPDLPLADPEGAERPDEATARARRAARWLHTERHALFASVRLAHSLGLDTETWALCEPLWTHYLDHPHRTDDIEAFRTGVAAASRAGHLPALVRMRCQLARPLWEQGETDEAADELERALATLNTLGDFAQAGKLTASAVEFRGMLRSAQGEWAAAAADFRRSREAHRAIPNPYGVMLQTYRLGQATAELGDLEAAALLLEQAHGAAVELKRDRLTARTGFALGGVLRGLGRTEEARAWYEAALAGARGRGSEADEARILDAFAALAEEAGRPDEAEEHRAAAHAIRVRNGLG